LPTQVQQVATEGILKRSFELSLLRSFELRKGERVVRIPLSAQRLLAFIALHSRPLQRPYVAGHIWPDFPEEHANANLRTALWRLQRPSGHLIDTRLGALALASNVAVDVHEVTARANRVLGATARPDDVAPLVAAGDLLPDWYDEWLRFERERFRELRLLALEALCDQLIAGGDFARALQAGLAAVAGEPLRESAHRAVIKAHLAYGNASEALREYRLFREIMRDKLGLEPSAGLRDLIAPPDARR
jgi:DNA-binding SARP family transcriptional activator